MFGTFVEDEQEQQTEIPNEPVQARGSVEEDEQEQEGEPEFGC